MVYKEHKRVDFILRPLIEKSLRIRAQNKKIAFLGGIQCKRILERIDFLPDVIIDRNPSGCLDIKNVKVICSGEITEDNIKDYFIVITNSFYKEVEKIKYVWIKL